MLPIDDDERPAPVAFQVEFFNGGEDDIAALITSENSNRRHLTPSQRAMATAFAFPEPEKGGRGQKALAAKAFRPSTKAHFRKPAPSLARTGNSPWKSWRASQSRRPIRKSAIAESVFAPCQCKRTQWHLSLPCESRFNHKKFGFEYRTDIRQRRPCAPNSTPPWLLWSRRGLLADVAERSVRSVFR